MYYLVVFSVLEVVLDNFGVDLFHVLIYAILGDPWVIAVSVCGVGVIVVEGCLFHVSLAVVLFCLIV